MKIKYISWLKETTLLVIHLYCGFFVHAQDIMVDKDGFSIPMGGHYNFDTIPADRRTEAVTFTIHNNSIHPVVFEGTTRIEVSDEDGTTPSLHFTPFINDLPGIINPGSTAQFDLQYTLLSLDGDVKRAFVVVKGMMNNVSVDYTFTVSCTAMTQGIAEFKEPGTFYWRAPVACDAYITLVGGGGGGGSGSTVRKSGSIVEMGGYGGGGGGAGMKLNIPVRLPVNVYTIIIGNYGIGASRTDRGLDIPGENGQNGESSFFRDESGFFSYEAPGGNGGVGGTITRDIWSVSGGAGHPDGDDSFQRRPEDTSVGGNGGNGGNGGDNDLGFGSYGLGSSGGSDSGSPGQLAPENSGGGGGGGGGAHAENDGTDSNDNRGGAGGPGGSGYCRIEWTGFLIQ